jgi:hypothetical protein
MAYFSINTASQAASHQNASPKAYDNTALAGVFLDKIGVTRLKSVKHGAVLWG